MASAFRPAVPPYISIQAGFAFMFWNIGLGSKFDESGRSDLMKVLATYTNLGTTVASSSAGSVTGERARRLISNALADPSTPSDAPAFGLIVPLFTEMQWQNMPGDIELIARLLADGRVRDLTGPQNRSKPLGRRPSLCGNPWWTDYSMRVYRKMRRSSKRSGAPSNTCRSDYSQIPLRKRKGFSPILHVVFWSADLSKDKPIVGTRPSRTLWPLFLRPDVTIR